MTEATSINEHLRQRDQNDFGRPQAYHPDFMLKILGHIHEGRSKNMDLTGYGRYARSCRAIFSFDETFEFWVVQAIDGSWRIPLSKAFVSKLPEVFDGQETTPEDFLSKTMVLLFHQDCSDEVPEFVAVSPMVPSMTRYLDNPDYSADYLIQFPLTSSIPDLSEIRTNTWF
jgi:hypothetical protein